MQHENPHPVAQETATVVLSRAMLQWPGLHVLTWRLPQLPGSMMQHRLEAEAQERYTL